MIQWFCLVQGISSFCPWNWLRVYLGKYSVTIDKCGHLVTAPMNSTTFGWRTRFMIEICKDQQCAKLKRMGQIEIHTNHRWSFDAKKKRWSNLSKEFFELSFANTLVCKHFYCNILHNQNYNLNFMISAKDTYLIAEKKGFHSERSTVLTEPCQSAR